MSRRCGLCGRADRPLVDVDDVAVCHGCIAERLDGAIPEHVSRGEAGPVCWWTCVCGRQVRRGRYLVDVDRLDDQAEQSDSAQLRREVRRIRRYRRDVDAVASGGVMLCWFCAVVAGVPLPAPAPPRLPDNVIEFAARRRA